MTREKNTGFILPRKKCELFSSFEKIHDSLTSNYFIGNSKTPSEFSLFIFVF